MSGSATTADDEDTTGGEDELSSSQDKENEDTTGGEDELSSSQDEENDEDSGSGASSQLSASGSSVSSQLSSIPEADRPDLMVGDSVLYCRNVFGDHTGENLQWARVTEIRPLFTHPSPEDRISLSDRKRLFLTRIKVYRLGPDGNFYCVNPGEGWTNWRTIGNFNLVIGGGHPFRYPSDQTMMDMISSYNWARCTGPNGHINSLDEEDFECIALYHKTKEFMESVIRRTQQIARRKNAMAEQSLLGNINVTTGALGDSNPAALMPSLLAFVGREHDICGLSAMYQIIKNKELAVESQPTHLVTHNDLVPPSQQVTNNVHIDGSVGKIDQCIMNGVSMLQGLKRKNVCEDNNDRGGKMPCYDNVNSRSTPSVGFVLPDFPSSSSEEDNDGQDEAPPATPATSVVPSPSRCINPYIKKRSRGDGDVPVTKRRKLFDVHPNDGGTPTTSVAPTPPGRDRVTNPYTKKRSRGDSDVPVTKRKKPFDVHPNDGGGNGIPFETQDQMLLSPEQAPHTINPRALFNDIEGVKPEHSERRWYNWDYHTEASHRTHNSRAATTPNQSNGGYNEAAVATAGAPSLFATNTPTTNQVDSQSEAAAAAASSPFATTVSTPATRQVNDRGEAAAALSPFNTQARSRQDNSRMEWSDATMQIYEELKHKAEREMMYGVANSSFSQLPPSTPTTFQRPPQRSSLESDPATVDCMTLHNRLVYQHGFRSDLVQMAMVYCGPVESACLQWLLDNCEDDLPNASEKPSAAKTQAMAANANNEDGELFQVDVCVDGGTGQVRCETVSKKKGHFHIGGHQMTHKYSGKGGIDTYWCKHNRAGDNSRCHVKMYHNRNTNGVTLFTSNGTPVQHTEYCQRKSQLLLATMATEEEESATASTQRVETGTNVAERLQQLVDEMAIAQPTVTAASIWRQVSQKMRDTYPGGWYGMSQQQVESRVPRIRVKVLGSNDMFRVAEHFSYKNIKNTQQPLLHYNLAMASKKDASKMDRIMVFSHPGLICLMNGKVDVYVDATFKCTPPPFYQTLILMVFDAQTKVYVACMWILMTCKNAENYRFAFHFVIASTGWTNIMPDTITCDYELALVKELRYQFKDSAINGCFFHFKQACRRKMKDLSLPDNQVKIAMRTGMLDLICLIPHEELGRKGVLFVFKRIVDEMRTSKIEVTDRHMVSWRVFFLQYMPKQWFRYMIDTWSIYGADGEKKKWQNRTNNALESYNRQFPKIFDRDHPNLLHFIEKLEEETRRLVNWLDDIRNGRSQGRPTYDAVSFPDLPPDYDDFDPDSVGYLTHRGPGR